MGIMKFPYFTLAVSQNWVLAWVSEGKIIHQKWGKSG